MKRKRFVKLLMADGWGRNDANQYADMYPGPYSVRYVLYCNSWAALEKQIIRASKIFAQAGITTLQVTDAIKFIAENTKAVVPDIKIAKQKRLAFGASRRGF